MITFSQLYTIPISTTTIFRVHPAPGFKSTSQIWVSQYSTGASTLNNACVSPAIKSSCRTMNAYVTEDGVMVASRCHTAWRTAWDSWRRYGANNMIWG